MGKEVSSIDLVLENCEEITIERKHIGLFLCDGLTDSILRLACNAVQKSRRCQELFLEIHKDANKQYPSFGEQSKNTVFERLAQFDDITAIDVHYDDGTSDYISVPWKEEDSEYINAFQTHYISDCGHMYICVSKEKSVTNMIDMDRVNNEELMEYQWYMFSDEGDEHDEE